MPCDTIHKCKPCVLYNYFRYRSRASTSMSMWTLMSHIRPASGTTYRRASGAASHPRWLPCTSWTQMMWLATLHFSVKHRLTWPVSGSARMDTLPSTIHTWPTSQTLKWLRYGSCNEWLVCRWLHRTQIIYCVGDVPKWHNVQVVSQILNYLLYGSSSEQVTCRWLYRHWIIYCIGHLAN